MSVPNIPTEGDCHFLGNKLEDQFRDVGWISSAHRCIRYKTVK
jgi:hypothetical protein